MSTFTEQLEGMVRSDLYKSLEKQGARLSMSEIDELVESKLANLALMLVEMYKEQNRE